MAWAYTYYHRGSSRTAPTPHKDRAACGVIKYRLRPVARVDADVLVGQVAGPERGLGISHPERKDDGNFRLVQFPVKVAFAEGHGAAAIKHFRTGHPNPGAVGVDLLPGHPGGSEDSTPVRIGARQSGFDQR